MKNNASLLIILLLTTWSALPAQDSVYSRAKIWEKDIERFVESDKKQFPERGGILFVGSSSFAMWEDVADYFPGHAIINRGFGGSELRDVIYYAEQIVFPYKPSQIVLYEGDNDIEGGASAESFVEDVKAFVRLLEIRMPGVPVLLVSVKNSPSREKLSPEYNKANAMLYAFAQSKKWVRFVDVNTLLRDNDGRFIMEYYREDGLHLTAKGYEVWAHQMRPYLVKWDESK